MFSSVTPPQSDRLSHDPFWWSDAPLRVAPQTDIKSHCDVAIIGAGYTGLTAALTLAKAGKSVQVFEAAKVGQGASSRNGGITSGSLRFGLDEAIKAFGETRGIGIYREAAQARGFLRQLIDENGIACDYDLTGLFTGAVTSSDFDNQRRGAERANDLLGSKLKVIERHQLPDVTGAQGYVGGVLNPDIGTIHPAKLVSGLFDAAVRNGAVVHTETPVKRLRRVLDGYDISTSRGDCRASKVIVATNGYTDQSNPWLRRRLVPVTSRIIVTEKLSPNMMSSLMPGRHAMGEVKKLFHYFRPTPDGKRILLGGREPGWTKDRSVAIGQLSAALTQIFPDLDGVRVSDSWAGNVAFSRQQLPSMFQHDGMHYVVGFCGSGTVWAPWLGHQTAIGILGGSKEASNFQAPPPPAIPFYSGTPWFLPLVISAYSLIDRIHGR